MTTLVTGASGFLGSHLTRQLVARGDDVRVEVRAEEVQISEEVEELVAHRLSGQP